MGKVLVINNADFSNVAVKQVTFQAGSYIQVGASLNKASSLVSGSGFYAIGETATISATNNSLYRFVKWSDGNTNATRTISISNEGFLKFTAEYELVFNTNSFTWGNGGQLVDAGKSSGSLNVAASTVGRSFVHTISECVFRIAPSYQDSYNIQMIQSANEKPVYGRRWADYNGYNSSTINDVEVTIPAGKWLDISIINKNGVSFTSDLSACANILEHYGTLEFT